MPLPDTIATFSYYISQICAMKPAYVQLVRYVPMMDPAIPSTSNESKSYKRGTPHDVLAVYGPIIKPPAAVLQEYSEAAYRGPAMPKASYDSRNPSPTRLFVNGGLTPSEADKLVEEEKIDAAVFGALWIGNPDLEKRLEKGMDVGHGINTNVDPKTFYNWPADGNPGNGYTDYPTST